MRQSISKLVLAAAVAAILPATAALAAPPVLNGIKILERVGNGNPSSNLVIANSNSNPGTVTITDGSFTQAGTNRHDARWSADGGATARNFSLTEGFTMQAVFNLTAGFNSGNRKEAGLRIISPITGDGLFIINSDAGEIVAFGGGMPFKSFGNNGGGNGYTPGQSILLGMNYVPGTGGNKGTLEYYIDRTPADGQATGFESSGALMIGNLEGGPVNYQVGAYAQYGTNVDNFPTDFGSTAITQFSITATPEPATLASLALGGLLLRRRRA